MGFTLVEIVLALGVISFAFVGVVGLLPFGLGVARDAIDTTISSQIVHQLTAQARQTDFSNLAALASVPPAYFDAQGNKAPQAEAIYQTGFTIAAKTPLPASATTGRLATVTICVLNLQSGRTSPETDLAKNPDSRKYAVLIADNGR